MFRILLVNTGSNVLVMVVKIVLTFIMTPLFVRNLGNYDYGLWEMVTAVVGYMGMLDLGIKPAISVYAARYRATDDGVKLHEVYATTFVFMTGIGVLLALILVGWGTLYGDLMAEEGGNPIKYTLFMLILAAQMLFVFPGYVAESFLEGFQKYYLKNNLTILNSIVGAIIFITFVRPGNALLLLAGINAVGLSLKYILFAIMLAKPAFGEIRLKWNQFRPGLLREMLAFSLKSFIQGVATRMEHFTDTLVIGAFLGPASVPFYSIPQNLVRYIQTLGWTLSHAFMPLFSDLAARSQRDKIREIYLVSSKAVVGIIAAIAVGVIVLATPFLALWIGPEYTEHSDIIVFLLVIFTVMPLLNPFSSRYLTAINRHGIFAKLMPVSAIANLILSIILVGPLGIIGVAMASVIPGCFLHPIILIYTCKQLDIRPLEYIFTSLVPLVLPMLFMGGIIVIMRWYVTIPNYATLILTVSMGAVVYLATFWLYSMNKEERDFITTGLSRRNA